MKRFHVTGTCIPEKHYMTEISSKLDQIVEMIEQDSYCRMAGWIWIAETDRAMAFHNKKRRSRRFLL